VSFVNLVSGGVDSILVGVLGREAGQTVHPLFIDYGQRARQREWLACTGLHGRLGLTRPRRVNVTGFGRLVRSGLTDPERNLVSEAFTPGRNALFLLMGAAYACEVGARAVAIGLIDEPASIFPDQRTEFLDRIQSAITNAVGRNVAIVAPLIQMRKAEVLSLAKLYGIKGTYWCHKGGPKACGRCISCQERARAKR